MAHQKHEADPWHVGRFDFVSYDVGAGSADGQCAQADPQVEQAGEVEQGDAGEVNKRELNNEKWHMPDYERILLPWLTVRYALQDGGKGVGQVEGEDEFDCRDLEMAMAKRHRGNLRSSVDAPRMLATCVNAASRLT